MGRSTTTLRAMVHTILTGSARLGAHDGRHAPLRLVTGDEISGGLILTADPPPRTRRVAAMHDLEPTTGSRRRSPRPPRRRRNWLAALFHVERRPSFWPSPSPID